MVDTGVQEPIPGQKDRFVITDEQGLEWFAKKMGMYLAERNHLIQQHEARITQVDSNIRELYRNHWNNAKQVADEIIAKQRKHKTLVTPYLTIRASDSAEKRIFGWTDTFSGEKWAREQGIFAEPRPDMKAALAAAHDHLTESGELLPFVDFITTPAKRTVTIEGMKGIRLDEPDSYSGDREVASGEDREIADREASPFD